MEASVKNATESGFPNLYASEDHIPAVKSRKSWIKNLEKPQNRQNVPEIYQTGHFQAIELYSIRSVSYTHLTLPTTPYV